MRSLCGLSDFWHMKTRPYNTPFNTDFQLKLLEVFATEAQSEPL